MRNAPARVSGAAPRVQEHLGAVPPVEVRAAAREIATERLGGVAPDRNDAFLAALADHSNEAVLEVDAGALEADRLGDAEAGSVQQLDERLVAERPRLRPGGGVDQPLGLAGRERLRKRPHPPRELHGRGRVVVACAEQLLVAEEAAGGRGPARDRRPGEPVGAELRGVPLELLHRQRRRPACRRRRPAPRDRGGRPRPSAATAARRAGRGSPRHPDRAPRQRSRARGRPVGKRNHSHERGCALS